MKFTLLEYRGAINPLYKAIKVDPSNTKTYNNSAIAKESLQDYKGAIDDCNMIMTIRLTFSEPYYKRGFTKLNIKD